MPVTLKRGDTFPKIEFLLEATPTGGGAIAPLDLTAATVILLHAKLLGGTLITLTCTKDPDQVTNKGKGTAALATDGSDTADIGDYDVEFKVTWAAGQIERFPNTGYESLTIEPNLDT